ncbi:MAG: TlpA family protein disulfide reductase [Ruminococcaceae bacterium]|nr:TlpA family protein disulfide reductase [Oscillospiraceae bacterium]
MKRITLLILCLSMLLCGCAAEESAPTTQTTTVTIPVATDPVAYSVTVLNEAGTALEKLTVEIYADAAKTDLLQVRTTDREGKLFFSAVPSEGGLVAVLKDVPAGYVVEAKYPLIDADTVISLKAGAPLTEEHLNHEENNALFSLGDAMPDFTVTASDGTEFTLSEALKSHDAVVLNFWYMGCTPCKMEFPYLQEAYEQFSDRVAVIALNPMDSTDAAIEAFRQENGYTFLMAKCDSRWGNMMRLTAYPMTMVIDCYGNITMCHSGSVDNTQMFMDMFGFFSAEDYEQTFIRSHSQLPTYEP